MIEPIKPDTPDGASGRDHAKGGWNLEQLERLISDCDNQPIWRARADLCAAYIDGKQLTWEQEQACISEGLAPRATNLIGRVIRGILGQEAKARTDIKVEADEDETADLCDVFNLRIKEAQREAYADMAVSNAYASQVGVGIGWVEIGRTADPLEYPYRVQDVHRSEMWWDWRAKDILLRDARWQCRKRWQDLDELEAAMPEHRSLLKQVSNGWAGFVFDDDPEIQLVDRFADEQRFQNYRRRNDWFDSARKRVKLYEVWYRVPAMAIVLHISPTRRVLYDEKNQSHIQAVASGQVKVTKSLTNQIRMSLYAGPHRLQDIGTTRRNFPYVPFLAYRDDETLTPYGLTEGMISPQDEYNERRLRIQWLLKARQITVDNDALDTNANSYSDLADLANRPDMLLILDAQRRNSTGVVISSNLQLQKEQVDVMQDAKQLIQDVPGVYGSQLGQAASGVTSGIANSLLIEQGSVSMGDLNDNYRHSRRLVFENLLDLICEDHQTENLQVKIGRGASRRVVVLNTMDQETGELVNQVKDAPIRVGLGEVPTTPAYRMQQQQQIATIIGALAGNPQAVAVLTPSFIEATDIPNRMELADDVRRLSGLPTAEDRQGQAAAQEQAQQKAAQAEQVQRVATKIELAQGAAKARLDAAKAEEIEQRVGIVANQPEDPAANEDQMIEEALAEAAA